MSKNEDRDRISYIIDSDSVIAVPGTFTTYAVIEYGLISGKTENEKYVSMYMREISMLIEASEKAIAYKMIM